MTMAYTAQRMGASPTSSGDGTTNGVDITGLLEILSGLLGSGGNMTPAERYQAQMFGQGATPGMSSSGMGGSGSDPNQLFSDMLGSGSFRMGSSTASPQAGMSGAGNLLGAGMKLFGAGGPLSGLLGGGAAAAAPAAGAAAAAPAAAGALGAGAGLSALGAGTGALGAGALGAGLAGGMGAMGGGATGAAVASILPALLGWI